jgi:hypothetical protein
MVRMILRRGREQDFGCQAKHIYRLLCTHHKFCFLIRSSWLQFTPFVFFLQYIRSYSLVLSFQQSLSFSMYNSIVTLALFAAPIDCIRYWKVGRKGNRSWCGTLNSSHTPTCHEKMLTLRRCHCRNSEPAISCYRVQVWSLWRHWCSKSLQDTSTSSTATNNLSERSCQHPNSPRCPKCRHHPPSQHHRRCRDDGISPNQRRWSWSSFMLGLFRCHWQDLHPHDCHDSSSWNKWTEQCSECGFPAGGEHAGWNDLHRHSRRPNRPVYCEVC